MPPVFAHEDVGALWLQMLQRAIGRAAHDVRDALNGVSVNLEVVRSRSTRADAPASAVAPFAESAAHQLERLATLIEAVLALSRAERAPADVAIILRRMCIVCGASSSARDAAIQLRETISDSATATSVAGDAVRLALAAPLLGVVVGADGAAPATEVTCTLGGNQEAIHVTIGAIGRRTAMPEAVADVLRTAGVRWTEEGNDLSLAFPRV